MADIDQDVQQLQTDLNDKSATRDMLNGIRSAYQIYQDALPTVQSAARQIYDPATDVFNANAEPYLTANEKQKVRDLFV